jgi:hypothetical protein
MFILNSRIFQTMHLLWAFLVPLYQDVLSNDKMTFRGGKLQVSLSDWGNYKNHSSLSATICSHRWARLELLCALGAIKLLIYFMAYAVGCGKQHRLGYLEHK